MTAPEWRDCADPDELAAAVAAGVEVLVRVDSGAVKPTKLRQASEFTMGIGWGDRYFLPTSWSPEPPASDDLAARARRHADGHPESRELELLGEVECTLAPDLVGLADGNEHPVTIPPDGCEAVFLPIDVVDRISRDGVGDIADACREAQARRGTTPTAPPVPPWPGAVLSGLVDEDGVPTWLAQAGQVRGEQVRACTSVPWLPNTSYGEDEWVEVRAPRAVPEPETERVDALKVLRDRSYRVVWMKDHAAPACSIGPWNDDVAVWSAAECRGYVQPIAPDGTVEVLKDGGQ